MAKMDQRQKGILVLTIAALLFLGWQVYSLISDDLSRKPAVVNPLNSTANSMNAVKSVADVPAPIPAIPAQQADPKAQVPTEEQQLPPELIKSLSFPARPEYLSLANQYEMAKMQRQLLEEQVAIANAQAQISKLAINSAASTAPTMGDSGAGMGGLELVFISEKAGHWTATLKDNGSYQFVVVGTRLPPNMEVLAIDHEGVLLAQGIARKKLTFNGMITLPKVSATQDTMKNAEQKTTRVL